MPAYRAVDNYVYQSVRNFLRRRHQAPSRGTRRFSDGVVFGELGAPASSSTFGTSFVSPRRSPPESRMREIRTSGLIGGDGKRGRRFGVSARARPRLYPGFWGDMMWRTHTCVRHSWRRSASERCVAAPTKCREWSRHGTRRRSRHIVWRFVRAGPVRGCQPLRGARRAARTQLQAIGPAGIEFVA